MSAESSVRIGLILPDVLGTYGDSGNATVLRKRLEWRGIEAEVLPVRLGDVTPSSLDLYVLGGGEDDAQALAADHLSKDPGMQRGVERGAVVFGVCAGLQVLGRAFTTSDGVTHPGLGLLDVSTSPGERRSVGEVVVQPDPRFGTEPLTGFENHLGITTVGPDSLPLGQVVRGTGNGEGTEGAVSGRVLATYLHGPALARNPELADLVLGWVVGLPLPPLDIPEVEQLRQERLARRRAR
ncbi:MAG TPA: glutamine amidotransferase [Amycolatopsis sp.]|uniref:type 1 glutamine amidotransferase n=1 Tax=Amycolatopsis sp. TaxID=37632 RepID=UPI002B4685F7|nr:glutamine amidotransferase [Amycolatopsis sp.]HKS43754.1 glutamine amidotransferase [Amycolatopsis sp.]